MQARGKLYKLNEFPPSNVFKVFTDKKIKTVNGEVLLVEFATEVGAERMVVTLIIPNRVIDEVIGETSIIMLYHKKAMSRNNKQFHDMSFVEVDKQYIHQNLARKKVKRNNNQIPNCAPINLNEKSLASFSDVNEEEIVVSTNLQGNRPLSCGDKQLSWLVFNVP